MIALVARSFMVSASARASPQLSDANDWGQRPTSVAQGVGCYRTSECSRRIAHCKTRTRLAQAIIAYFGTRSGPRCGAKTRAGGTCLVRVELGKPRCRFHGRLSRGQKPKPACPDCRGPAPAVGGVSRGRYERADSEAQRPRMRKK
jgi:hypothetical protein